MWHLQLHLRQKAVVAAHDQLSFHVGCWSSVQVLHDEKHPIAGDVLVLYVFVGCSVASKSRLLVSFIEIPHHVK